MEIDKCELQKATCNMQLRYLLVYLRDRGRVTNTSATMCQLLCYISSWQLATHKKREATATNP
jgi:hypothetical protein